MQIQYVSKYIALSKEGLVPRLECPLDQGLLMSNEDLNGNIYIYCLSCSYKKNIGLEFYDKLCQQIKGL